MHEPPIFLPPIAKSDTPSCTTPGMPHAANHGDAGPGDDTQLQATRAAADLGYQCIVAADACATRNLEWNGSVIDASAVHQATLATLDGVYAGVMTTGELVE